MTLTEQKPKILTKKTFYARNWDGPNRVRRAELELMAIHYELEFNDENSNYEIFLKIDKFFSDKNRACAICIEPFNKSNRKQIKCSCDYECCTECTKTYLFNQSQNPHCMNCKMEWNMNFMIENFTKKFMYGEFKIYRQNILFEREMGLMAQTQVYVDKEINDEKIYDEIFKIENKINELLNLKSSLYDALNNSVVKSEFIRKCPNNDCRGFLSTNLKCGICEIWACKDCNEIKGFTHDAEHTCNPDTVASVLSLQKECRSCPKCDYKIFKTEGCNQMYCTPEFGGCGTAFCWKTGRIETKIHNPHFFEFMRKQGTLQRDPNEIRCGREIDVYFANSLFNKTKNDFVHEICRSIIHINQVEIPAYRLTEGDDNLRNRIKYMRNRLEKEKFIIDIEKNEHEKSKNHEFYNILSMFVQCLTDIMYRFNDDISIDILSEIDNLRQYTNQQLLLISKNYKCSKKQFNEKLEYKKFTQKRITVATPI